MTGYSGTPLPRKLGIEPGAVLLLLDAAPGFTIPDLPPVTRQTQPSTTPYDVALWFPASTADLAARLPTLRAAMTPAAGLWIAWPKRASGLPTDLTDHVIRAVALPTGLVDNKVCALDPTYSALRLVIRRELRT